MSKNKILVTGATGFLGGAVVAQLVCEGRSDEVLALARAASPQEALARVIDQLRLYEVPEARIAELSEAHILFGDLADPRWAQDPRATDISVIINCAAVASFGNNPRIWSVNVDDTFAFAEAASGLPALKRFLHVGTGMACGAQASSPVTECYEFDGEVEHLVPYTQSKATIEARIHEELPHLPFVVARPSIVVGHSRLGCKPSSSIFWVFKMGKALGEFMCEYDDKIDVIPVDWCADALLRLAQKPELQWSRYHLSAGPDASCTFREIDLAMSAALGVEPMNGYQQVDYARLYARRAQFAEMFGARSPKIILKAIKLYGGFSSLNFIFCNRRLRDEGVQAPPRFVEYLERCIETTAGTSIAEQMIVDFK